MTDLWEKCTRLMLLWNEGELDSFLNIIEKISANITSHPEELKYQRLKHSNRVVSEKINALTGGSDFMLAMGFDVLEDEGDGVEKVYVLRRDGLESLTASVEWLSDTVAACKSLIQAKKDASPALNNPSTLYAAACQLQLRLPTGTAVQGGFMGSDCIADVRRFAQHFFKEDRHTRVLLRLPHAAPPLDPDSPESLASLHLLPRCVLLASTLSAADRDASFKQAHVEAVVHEAEKASHKQQARQSKKMEHEQRLKEKSDILRAFKEDHGRDEEGA